MENIKHQLFFKCNGLQIQKITTLQLLLSANADITMIDGYGYHLPDKMKTRKNGTDAKGWYTVFVGVQG